MRTTCGISERCLGLGLTRKRNEGKRIASGSSGQRAPST